MAITEQDRRNIFNSLEASIGSTDASNLMELLPTTPADHLVTRHDMHANTALLRGEMAEMSAELRIEMGDLRAELRGEMGELRTELRGEMVELRTELKDEMAELRTELRGEMVKLRADMVNMFATAKVETNRMIMASMAANAVAVITALVA